MLHTSFSSVLPKIQKRTNINIKFEIMTKRHKKENKSLCIKSRG